MSKDASTDRYSGAWCGDSAVEQDAEIELTLSQRQELDRRLKVFEIDEIEGVSWTTAKVRILSQ